MDKRRVPEGARRILLGPLVVDFAPPRWASRDDTPKAYEVPPARSVRVQRLRQPHQVHRLDPVAESILAPVLDR
jgi:hypothetical protein